MAPRHGWHQLHMVERRSTRACCCPQSAWSLYHGACCYCASVQEKAILDVVHAVLLERFASHFVMVKWTIHLVET
ncbi:hypothetical protein DPMN_026586 [Dreissena polymorpha]|uniref:Uncharacterized protein n=1 Tax=Dreissena polymorpha TaxID=45954 RepID=A0A9D4LTP2_DREPO|nr:hypothetical protein DPMN_026586 [Dreissena polymorpha]